MDMFKSLHLRTRYDTLPLRFLRPRTCPFLTWHNASTYVWKPHGLVNVARGTCYGTTPSTPQLAASRVSVSCIAPSYIASFGLELPTQTFLVTNGENKKMTQFSIILQDFFWLSGDIQGCTVSLRWSVYCPLTRLPSNYPRTHLATRPTGQINIGPVFNLIVSFFFVKRGKIADVPDFYFHCPSRLAMTHLWSWNTMSCRHSLSMAAVVSVAILSRYDMILFIHTRSFSPECTTAEVLVLFD